MPSYFFADMVREVSSTSGLVALVLDGPVPGHRRFADAVPVGAPFFYAIVGVATPAEWETGIGTLLSDGRLQRDTVKASSAGSGKVNFGPGLKTIALTVGSEWFTGQQSGLAETQPISTSHGAVALAEASDLVTLRRGSDWVNLPVDVLMRRGASGRYAATGAMDIVSGSAAAAAISIGPDAGCGLFRPGANMLSVTTGGSERMRIAANGNVGIGSTVPSRKLTLRDANWPTILMEKEGIGEWELGVVASNDFAISVNGNVYVQCQLGAGLAPGTDNALNLGTGVLRWGSLFAATGTISTSDAREKRWRGALTAAELRAAGRIVREIGVFQWTDAIANKGADAARFHIGVRAQAVWAIMADEGLVDPIGPDGQPGRTPYAFLCWDAVGDAGRFGVRVDQLALFVAAGQEQRLARLEDAA